MKLIWKEDTRQYSSGEVGLAGEIRIFNIAWDTAEGSKSNKPWILYCALPGINEKIGKFTNPEDAKNKAESIMELWLSKIGVTCKDTK